MVAAARGALDAIHMLTLSSDYKICFIRLRDLLNYESEAANFKTRLKVTPKHVFDVNGVLV